MKIKSESPQRKPRLSIYLYLASSRQAPNNCCAGARATGLSINAEGHRAPGERSVGQIPATPRTQYL
jgi:hypothetical protein